MDHLRQIAAKLPEYGIDAMGAIDWLQHTTEEGG